MGIAPSSTIPRSGKLSSRVILPSWHDGENHRHAAFTGSVHHALECRRPADSLGNPQKDTHLHHPLLPTLSGHVRAAPPAKLGTSPASTTSDAASSDDGNRQRDPPDQQMPFAGDFLMPTANNPTVTTNIPLRHCPGSPRPSRLAVCGSQVLCSPHRVNRRIRRQPRTLHRHNFIGEPLTTV